MNLKSPISNPPSRREALRTFGAAAVCGLLILLSFGAVNVTPTGSGTGSSNAVVQAAGFIDLTNQIRIRQRDFSGSATSQQLDFNAMKYVCTNQLNTNVTFNLTNPVPGEAVILEVPGNTLGTNFTLTVNISGGGSVTNLKWLSPTNGSATVVAQSNCVYTFVFNCSGTPTTTNIIASWSTDSGNPIRGLVSAVAAGAGPTNATLGGRIWQDLTARTNHSSAGNFTNLATFTVPAHTLTNDGDALRFEARGAMLSGSNSFSLGYGSITGALNVVLTNGHAVATWQTRMTVTRTGATAQMLDLEWWTSPGFGIAYFYTNFTTTLAETNGIANLLRFQGACLGQFRLTNQSAKLWYEPAAR